MNSSHQTPFMDKSIPIWLLKNPKFMEQLKREKEQKILKEKLIENNEASSSKIKITEID